jgi:hypothetical protein
LEEQQRRQQRREEQEEQQRREEEQELEELERQLEEEDDAPPGVLPQQTMTDVKEITAPAPEVTAAEAAEAYNRGIDAVIAAWEERCPILSKDECEKTKQCKTETDGKCAVNKEQITLDMRI